MFGVGAIGKGTHPNREVSGSGTRPGKKLNTHWRSAGSYHIESDSRRVCEIQNSIADEWPAIDDANFNLASIIQVGDAQNTAEGQRAVSGYERIHVKDFAVCSAASVNK